tara:strand:- start:224 stop:535 length:312 start_codon:yes stop_codon:yes gene_type:complete
MTIGELIERLEEAKDALGEDVEVRYASQPSWPFENNIREVHILGKHERRELAIEAMREEGMPQEQAEKEFDEEELENTEDVVYLEEGFQIGYLSGEAKEHIGW